MNQLGYEVIFVENDDKSLKFKFNFDNPLSLSLGEEPDILVIEFVEPEFFIGKESGKTLASDNRVITKNIPK